MEGGKKIIVIVMLLAVIVAGGVYLVKTMGRGEPEQPDWVLDQPVEKIDSESLELVTKPLGEWKSLGYKDGKYKNPKTGDYSMDRVAICAACGEKIPMPGGTTSTKPSGDEMDPSEAAQARRDRVRESRCPRCGELAAPSGVAIRPGRGPESSPRPE